MLQSQHEDLTEECSKIRKEKLEGIEEKSHLEKMLSAVKLEMQQTTAAKEKSLEAMKVSLCQLVSRSFCGNSIRYLIGMIISDPVLTNFFLTSWSKK